MEAAAEAAEAAMALFYFVLGDYACKNMGQNSTVKQLLPQRSPDKSYESPFFTRLNMKIRVVEQLFLGLSCIFSHVKE